jgi:hypothetical protein
MKYINEYIIVFIFSNERLEITSILNKIFMKVMIDNKIIYNRLF